MTDRLSERLEDFVAAAEQREVELRGIRDELRRQADAVERSAAAGELLVDVWRRLADTLEVDERTEAVGGLVEAARFLLEVADSPHLFDAEEFVAAQHGLAEALRPFGVAS